MTKMVSAMIETEDCNIETIASNEGSLAGSRASIQSQTTPTPAPPAETPMMDESNSRPNSQENLDEQNSSETTQSNADQTEYIIEDTSRAKLGGEVKEILASGSVLSSELISKLLKDKLTSIPLEKGWVIVGFPTSLGKIQRFRPIDVFGESIFLRNRSFRVISVSRIWCFRGFDLFEKSIFSGHRRFREIDVFVELVFSRNQCFRGFDFFEESMPSRDRLFRDVFEK